MIKEFLIAYICLFSTSQAIIVFDRYDSLECTEFPGVLGRLEPPSIPVPGLTYEAQTKITPTNNSPRKPVGRFTEITLITVSFQFMNGTNITTPVNTTGCVDHPAFNFGRFIDVPGPIIGTLSRRVYSSSRPSPITCRDAFYRDQYSWIVSAHYPIVTNQTSCPTRGTYIFIQNGNIASIRFGFRVLPEGVGCFNDTDPQVAGCLGENPRRYCSPNDHCVAPAVSDKIYPFSSVAGTVQESVRILNSNVFPLEDSVTPTTISPTPTSSGSCFYITWPILFLLMILPQ